MDIMKLDQWKQQNGDYILVVSYEELRANQRLSNNRRWNYIVLDEGSYHLEYDL